MKKLAVLFPGIGYTADRPLLYYCRRVAAGLGYETRALSYDGFPADVRGNPEAMTACYKIALRQAAAELAAVDWGAYDEILFAGKSVGAGVAAWLASQNPAREKIRLVLYTPLEETFALPTDRAIVFTGTADPWVGGEGSRIPALCRARDLPCIVIPGGNHSLETGDIAADLRHLAAVTEKTGAFLRGEL